MPARALIEVDLRIAALRDQTAQGNATAQTAAQLDGLLKKRGELIEKMVAERAGKSLPSISGQED